MSFCFATAFPSFPLPSKHRQGTRRGERPRMRITAFFGSKLIAGGIVVVGCMDAVVVSFGTPKITRSRKVGKNCPPSITSKNSKDGNKPSWSASRPMKAYTTCSLVKGGLYFFVPWMKSLSFVGLALNA